LFGQLIHELTGPLVPTVLPGVSAVHAVDASGVHPLLFAIGSERYTPYAKARRPMEILTQANAILGQGQMSLAKYVWIAAKEDAPTLDIHDLGAFFTHMLERVDWTRDLHFQTRTTMDTLDYSGSGLNEGSKIVIAAAGEKKRTLSDRLSPLLKLAPGFADPRIVIPGIVVLRGPEWQAHAEVNKDMQALAEHMHLHMAGELSGYPLFVVCDDAEFASRTLSNFIWITFTRSNPAVDIVGVGARVIDKHWGCTGPLLIDARRKAHHAAPLVEDPAVSLSVDRFFTRNGNGPLRGIEK
jgi:4-hydroxy-3-polyprenylbenzoate decarboxylase